MVFRLDGKTVGLSSPAARKALFKSIKGLAMKYDKKKSMGCFHKFKKMLANLDMYHFFGVISFLITHVIMAAFLRSQMSLIMIYWVDIPKECTIIVSVFLLSIIFKIERPPSWEDHIERIFEDLLNTPANSNSLNIKMHKSTVSGHAYTFVRSQESTVATLREKEWKVINSIMLVKDDIFKCSLTSPLPADCTRVKLQTKGFKQNDRELYYYENDRYVFKKGYSWKESLEKRKQTDYNSKFGETNDKRDDKAAQSKFNVDSDTDMGIFVVETTPSTQNLEEYIIVSKRKSPSTKRKLFGSETFQIKTKVIRIVGVLLIASIIFSLIRMWGMKSAIKSQFFCILLIRAAYAILSMFPLMDLILTNATLAWGIAKLCIEFENKQLTNKSEEFLEQSVSSFSTWTLDSSYIDSTKSNLSKAPMPRVVQLVKTFSVLRKGIDKNSNILFKLNAATILAFINKEGLITDKGRAIQEVCVCRSVEKLGNIESDNPRSTTTSPISSVKLMSTQYLHHKECKNDDILCILDLQTNAITNTIEFQSDSFKESRSILRALGSVAACTGFPNQQPNRLCSNAWLGHFCVSDVLSVNGQNAGNLIDCNCDFLNLCDYSSNILKFIQKKRYVVVIPNCREKNNPKNDMLGCLTICRDTRKATGHIFSYGNSELIGSLCSMYYDGNVIHPISQEFKDSLTNIIGQWKSSGLDITCFSSRPLTPNESMLVNNLSDITMARVENPLNDAATDLEWSFVECFPGLKSAFEKDPQDFIGTSSIQEKDNQQKEILPNDLKPILFQNHIFFGMVASRLESPTDMIETIRLFHNAGIRFVHFSPDNTKRTRMVGSLVGLEMSFNSCVSLSDDHSVDAINQVGRVVLPSGIEQIKQHIRDIDNVPLQLSLYSDCTSERIREMIALLQEEGEVIISVGNSLNGENFGIFQDADCSISIKQCSDSICKSCFKHRKLKRSDYTNTSKANFEDDFAARVITTPCDLKAKYLSTGKESAFLITLLYETIFDSRKIVHAISQSIRFYVSTLLFLLFLNFLQIIVGSIPLINGTQYLSILFISSPIIAISLLASPSPNLLEEQFPPKSLVDQWELRITAKIYRFIGVFGISATLIWFITTLNASLMLGEAFISLQSSHHSFTFTPNETNAINMCKASPWMGFFSTKWISCLNHLSSLQSRFQLQNQYTDGAIQSTNFWTTAAVLLFINLYSTSYINEFKSIISYPPSKNRWWLLSNGIICFILGFWYMLLKNIYLHRIFQHPSKYITFSYFGIIGILIFLEQLVKLVEYKHYCDDQKYLTVLFGTKLGMWSPK